VGKIKPEMCLYVKRDMEHLKSEDRFMNSSAISSLLLPYKIASSLYKVW
jgi:hypothetical protein